MVSIDFAAPSDRLTPSGKIPHRVRVARRAREIEPVGPAKGQDHACGPSGQYRDHSDCQF